MKFINVPVSVDARKGIPRRIRRGRRIYTVRRVIDFWILQSRWWGCEEKRVYFRLETDSGVVEIYRTDASAAEAAAPARDASEPPATVQDATEPAAVPSSGHPPFVEGDTHTRELRQTESPYRPDAAALADRRQAMATGATRKTTQRAASARTAAARTTETRAATASTAETPTMRGPRPYWVLTKVMD